MKLFHYSRSSAAYRVRIALHWKKLDFESHIVNLLEGEHREPGYLAINPQGLVPTFVDDDLILTQSLAILEYLEERHPEPPLLPKDPVDRARVRQLALIVACEVHPLQNSGVAIRLGTEFGFDGEAHERWFHGVVERGLTALESLVAEHPATSRFCHGDAPTLADVCLVPQLYNARRREFDLSDYPTLVRIESACMELDAFQSAVPEAWAA